MRSIALAAFAFVLAGCGVTVPDDSAGEEDDLAYATDEATKAPPEAPAPAPAASSGGSATDPSGGGGGGGAGGKATVAFARATKERRYGIQITDAARKEPRVIYSIRLPNLSSEERLRIRGEVALSRCNTKDIAGDSGDAKTTPCNSKDMKANPYNYDPRFEATFVLGDRPNDAKGMKLGAWVDHTCSESQHHCALPLPEVSVGGLDNAAEKYLNLVVAAEAPGTKARSWDVMEVEQSKGGLYVTRSGKGAGAVVTEKKSDAIVSTGKLGIDQTEDEGDKTQVHRIVYRVKLEGLQPGDVIDVDARLRAVLHMGSLCDPLMTGQILLTKQNDDTEAAGDGEERITAKNGRNCVDHGPGGCAYEKSGAVQIGKNANSTMFVNYVVVALRSCAAPNGADKWSVEGGFLRASVRR
jgi:NMD protein affecting ribosome stability and mRNA decay